MFTRRKIKPPAELAKQLQTLLRKESFVNEKEKKTFDIDLAKVSNSFKVLLYGKEGYTPTVDIAAALVQESYRCDIIYDVVKNLHKFSFESRKDIIQAISNLVRRHSSGELVSPNTSVSVPIVQYAMVNHPDLISLLLDGYTSDSPLSHGAILKELVRHKLLAERVLALCASEEFLRIFNAMSSPNFDVSSDACLVFKDLLVRHKSIVTPFLTKEFDLFFQCYEQLVLCPNYATRRFSLKLLCDVLLDRHNFSVMTRFIALPHQLRLVMRLLKDPSQAIQYEAFHIFKVFVANPNKSEQVVRILSKNKDRLIKYLRDFNASKDDELEDEKVLLINEISRLPSHK